ncbi:hypothetical protein CI102_11582 [Trichoderma harzianum]|uniref:Uncharacterized protein n=1 Tax=Trichoderma harzianum CBS 226.95 TaxID=983964 RepID=A0A2T4A2A2_TRIHA|nr:hypothetical protein M431DRAFT_234644 [Trichoderma harzianum CBS 226.95]PKK44238.1 hypothetical protein CI102_11582 [Trichoderma harzianum]PTB51103.1 hypothetical protein M431DRAFT_234644 [Trichoderma harzianum CBS 226.95]
MVTWPSCQDQQAGCGQARHVRNMADGKTLRQPICQAKFVLVLALTPYKDIIWQQERRDGALLITSPGIPMMILVTMLALSRTRGCPGNLAQIVNRGA